MVTNLISRVSPSGVIEIDNKVSMDGKKNSTDTANENFESHSQRPKKGNRYKREIAKDRDGKSKTKQRITRPSTPAEDEFNQATKKTKNGQTKQQSETKSTTDDEINWPENDLQELFRRMESSIPEKDSFSYCTRAEKLDWGNIAFDSYSAEECKRIWHVVQKRIRRFRLLSEMLADAKEWISKPWTNFYRSGKTKRHPEMPRRPLTSYMLFYLDNKNQVVSENPGIDMTKVSKKIAKMYKKLTKDQMEKYNLLATEKKKEYEKSREEFLKSHPDVAKPAGKVAKTLMDMRPKKPSTPFLLFYKEQVKKVGPQENSTVFKEQCKDQWKNMAEKKKVVWINWAEEGELKYRDDLKNYVSQNPEFVPAQVKSVLTKEEKLIKERVAGKPVKPPNSAYSLFSRIMLQGEDIKSVQAKDRMNVIAHHWKSCKEEEKKEYKERCDHMMEQYKLDFATYLESLSDEKRAEELQNNSAKRRLKTPCEPEPKKLKQRKRTPAVKTSSKKMKNGTANGSSSFAHKGEPQRPPMNAFELFGICNPGKPVKKMWEKLSEEEKRQYAVQVKQLKEKFIAEFETFLKSLTKREVVDYQKQKHLETQTCATAGNEDSSSSCSSDSESLESEDS